MKESAILVHVKGLVVHEYLEDCEGALPSDDSPFDHWEGLQGDVHVPRVPWRRTKRRLGSLFVGEAWGRGCWKG